MSFKTQEKPRVIRRGDTASQDTDITSRQNTPTSQCRYMKHTESSALHRTDSFRSSSRKTYAASSKYVRNSIGKDHSKGISASYEVCNSQSTSSRTSSSTPMSFSSASSDVSSTPSDISPTPTDTGSASSDVSSTPTDISPTPTGTASSDVSSTPSDIRPTPTPTGTASSDVSSTPSDISPTLSGSASPDVSSTPTPTDISSTPSDISPTPSGSVSPDVSSTPSDISPTPTGTASSDVSSTPTPSDISPTPSGTASSEIIKAHEIRYSLKLAKNEINGDVPFPSNSPSRRQHLSPTLNPMHSPDISYTPLTTPMQWHTPTPTQRVPNLPVHESDERFCSTPSASQNAPTESTSGPLPHDSPTPSPLTTPTTEFLGSEGSVRLRLRRAEPRPPQPYSLPVSISPVRCCKAVVTVHRDHWSATPASSSYRALAATGSRRIPPSIDEEEVDPVEPEVVDEEEAQMPDGVLDRMKITARRMRLKTTRPSYIAWKRKFSGSSQIFDHTPYLGQKW